MLEKIDLKKVKITVNKIVRYEEIEVDYLDQDFKLQHGKYKDYTAQIIQHEIDHGMGILI